MKTGIGSVWVVWAWVALAMVTPGVGATVEELRSIYEQQLERVKAECSPAAVLSEYAAQLDAANKAAREAGDLMGYVALQKEQERIRTEKTIPLPAPANMDKRAALLRQTYGTRLSELSVVRDRNILTLTQQYVQRLNSEGSALIKGGDTAAAMRFHAEAERVKGSQTVLSAEFGVAAGAPSGGLASGAPPAAGPAAPPAAESGPQTIKARKRVSAKGSMTAAWIVTATRVDPGDKVIVTASGRWQCPRISSPCGPSGYPRSSYHGYSWYGESLQYVEINYGALLCRIGSGGAARAVNDRLEFVADASGPLQFTCNVKDDPGLRKQCSGDMDVEIEVARKAGDSAR